MRLKILLILLAGLVPATMALAADGRDGHSRRRRAEWARPGRCPHCGQSMTAQSREAGRERMARFDRRPQAEARRGLRPPVKEAVKPEKPKAKPEAKERPSAERVRRAAPRAEEQAREKAAPRSETARLLEELRRLRQELQSLRRDVDQLKAARGPR